MNIRRVGSIFLVLVCLLMVSCSQKPVIFEKPKLFITLKDALGNSVDSATVRLYKNAQDSGITQMSDTGGIVIFRNLDPALYYWFAQKGCATNRISQTTLNKPLIENAVLYGYSIMYQTSTLKITNTSAELYKVTDAFFNIKLPGDTTYIVYPIAGSRLIHSEKVSTPGMGKDTLIKAQCGDTSILMIPY
ncbi:MAG: hypothetical protein ABI691_16690 [Ginsengibacter sp.]